MKDNLSKITETSEASNSQPERQAVSVIFENWLSCNSNADLCPLGLKWTVELLDMPISPLPPAGKWSLICVQIWFMLMHLDFSEWHSEEVIRVCWRCKCTVTYWQSLQFKQANCHTVDIKPPGWTPSSTTIHRLINYISVISEGDRVLYAPHGYILNKPTALSLQSFTIV